MSTARSKQQNGGGHSNKGLASKQMIDRIKEATGQSEEDITTMLMECNYDVNETIVALIENPFCQVTGKKDKLRKKEEDRKKDAFKVVEVRRQGTGGRQRPQERAGPPPAKPPPAARAPPTDMLTKPGEVVLADVGAPSATAISDTSRGAPALGSGAPAAPKTKSWASAANGGRPAGTTMADLFKRPPQPVPPPPPPAPETPAQNGVPEPEPEPIPQPDDTLASAAPPADPPAANAWGVKPPATTAGLGSSLLSALSSSNNAIADTPLASSSLSGSLHGTAPTLASTLAAEGGVLFPQGGDQLGMTSADRDLQVEFGAFSLNDSSSRTLSGGLGLDTREPVPPTTQPTSLGLDIGSAAAATATTTAPAAAPPTTDPASSLGLGAYAAPAAAPPTSMGVLSEYATAQPSTAAAAYAGFGATPQPPTAQPQDLQETSTTVAAALPDTTAAPPQYAGYGAAAPGGGLTSQYLSGYGSAQAGYGMQSMGGQYGGQYDTQHLDVDASKAYGGYGGMYGTATAAAAAAAPAKQQEAAYGAPAAAKYGSATTGSTSVPSTATTDVSLQSTPSAAGAAGGAAGTPQQNAYSSQAYQAQMYNTQYGMQYPHMGQHPHHGGGYYGMPQAGYGHSYGPAPTANPNAYMPNSNYGGAYQQGYGNRGPQGGYGPAQGNNTYMQPNSNYGGGYQGGHQQGGLYGRGHQGGAYSQRAGGYKQQGGDGKYDAMSGYN